MKRNSLAETYPELLSEWSERNFPLTPDMVNEKSRKNVWWKCKVCGYEWKSVIHSRIKGTVCPDIVNTPLHLFFTKPFKRREGKAAFSIR